LRFRPRKRPEAELRDVPLLVVVSLVVVFGCRGAGLWVTYFPEMEDRYCLLDRPRFFRAVARS
jgi:hypothetical protein